DLLAKKIDSYEKFSREYPGFGGFLPWFLISDDGMKPTWDWEDRVPALDNGQLAWSLFLAASILKEEGFAELSRRYEAYWKRLAKNAVPVFFSPVDGKIRGVAKIRDVKS